jgi:hypothetical protein
VPSGTPRDLPGLRPLQPSQDRAVCSSVQKFAHSNFFNPTRKLILCALSNNEFEKAKSAFHSMSEAGQNEPLTRYIAYKAAIRSCDRGLAADCLETLSKVADKDLNLLYACTMDAQQAGDKWCAVAALRTLVEKHAFAAASDIHLPALFRCTLRLMRSLLVSDNVEGQDECFDLNVVVEDICKTFEAGR